MTAPSAPPPLDELLARREWVRRFARTLARDDASADDLAQDAWVSTIEHPPRHADAPAGWFRRVLTRRAMNRARGERRREAHETAASRPDVTPSTADVVAAAESHRRVVEAVMALDEPYRATVLLRFFEDLPPREVAARMNVPVETVRSRVRRAVEMLRARLDEEHDGRRAAWLGPLLGAGDKPPTPTHIAPVVKGVVAMAAVNKTLVATAVVALLLIGGALVFAAHVTDRRDVAANAARAASKSSTGQWSRTHGDERSPDADADASARAPSNVVAAPAEAKDATPARTFIARVVDPGHVPVEGVRVFLNMGRAIPVGERPPTAVSDAQGCARFEIVGRVSTLWIDSEGADGGAFAQQQSQPTIPENAQQVDVVVERRAWIKGRVVSDTGVAGKMALVVALQGRERVSENWADADGNFRFVVQPNDVFDLSLTGWASARPLEDDRGVLDGKISGIPSGAVDVVIVARPVTGTGTVRVKAVTSEGGPVAGVALYLSSYNGNSRFGAGRTDSSGRWECADVPNRLAAVQINVGRGEIPPSEKDGWITPNQKRLVRPGDPEVVFVFARGRPVRGRVEFCESYPKPNVPGWTRPHASISVDHGVSSTYSDDEGRFTLLVPADAPGPFRISSAVRVMADNRYFEGAVEGVLPGADNVVLKIVETKR